MSAPAKEHSESIFKKSKNYTKFYTPFVSNYPQSSDLYTLQGIKLNSLGCREKQTSYIITGTTGSAFTAGGIGAVYVGPIDGKDTSAGSGSGRWFNFNVPFEGNTGTSCYGADILSPGKRSSDMGNVELVGTWTDTNNNILGFYYKGNLNQLESPSYAPSNFKSFQADQSDSTAARYTYLHSIDGGYAVGNYSTRAGYVGWFLNSGFESGSYVYNPKTNSQTNAVYKDDYSYHTLFGIWYNNNKTYTVSGGGTNAQLLTEYGSILSGLPNQDLGLPQDAAFGRGMLADIDPVTGNAKNEKYYNYQNNPSDQILTHFQGIYYAGKGVYEVPFDAITSTGEFNIGIAYIKRQDNGKFSDEALWQTFQAPSTGILISNDSVAGSGSVGAIASSSLTTFASIRDTDSYLLAAQSLH